MPRTALVTGVAGFIGSHIAERLVADGWRVRGIDCFTDYYARGRKERNLSSLRGREDFELVEADIANTDLGALVDDVDTIFHQAAQAGVRASWGALFASYTNHNVLSTQLLLERAKQVGTRRFVYASSSSVYGQTDDLPMTETSRPKPYSPYGVTKLAAEHLCELYRHNFGVSAISLRYFTVYGPRQRPDMAFSRFISASMRGDEITLYGDGQQTRDFTFVGDIVEANVRAADASVEGVFNVGGGSRVVLKDVIDTLGELLGGALSIDQKSVVAGDVRHTNASTKAIEQALDFKPTTSLEDGLAKQVDWFKKHGADPA